MEDFVSHLHMLTVKMAQMEELEKARKLSQNLSESTHTAKGKGNVRTEVAYQPMDEDGEERKDDNY